MLAIMALALSALRADGQAADTRVRGCAVLGTGTIYALSPTSGPTACRENHRALTLLPSVATENATSPLLYLTNTGTSYAAVFEQTGSQNATALLARNSSGWHAAAFQNTGTVGGAVWGSSRGTGPTGYFENLGTTGPALALRSFASGPTVVAVNEATSGVTAALHAFSSGSGATVVVENRGTGDAMQMYATTAVNAVHVANRGTGNAMSLASSSGDATLVIAQNGSGRALRTRGDVAFEGRAIIAGAGLPQALLVQGRADIAGSLFVNGNQIAGGTKSAVVATSRGARQVYTEESAEVWFTDYGFARLEAGRVWVPIDDVFRETIAAEHPYHVFVQGYGDGVVYVSRRTSTGFEVRAGVGADLAAEFSYRLVARRRGYESRRLEPSAVMQGSPPSTAPLTTTQPITTPSTASPSITSRTDKPGGGTP